MQKLISKPNNFRLRAGNFRVIFKIFSTEKILKITRIRRRNEKTYREFLFLHRKFLKIFSKNEKNLFRNFHFHHTFFNFRHDF